MQTAVRYYITCDDDQPVVRTIPVTVKISPKVNDDTAVNTEGVRSDDDKSRAHRLALGKARRLRGHGATTESE